MDAFDALRVEIMPCDIFLTRSYTWLGWAIRFFERGFGEEPSVVNHTGIFLNHTSLFHAASIEALGRVREGRFWSFYHGQNVEVAIYRDLTLTEEDRKEMVTEALKYKGHIYGVLKLPLHALDWALARVLWKQDVYFFRRLGRIPWVPICSYYVTKLFAFRGRFFGKVNGDQALPVPQAQPDDIWDFVTKRTDKYACILPLQRI
jgi:hypothetical protein